MSLKQRIHELMIKKEWYEKLQEERSEDAQMLSFQREQDEQTGNIGSTCPLRTMCKYSEVSIHARRISVSFNII
jgi:hypothetical protein